TRDLSPSMGTRACAMSGCGTWGECDWGARGWSGWPRFTSDICRRCFYRAASCWFWIWTTRSGEAYWAKTGSRELRSDKKESGCHTENSKLRFERWHSAVSYWQLPAKIIRPTHWTYSTI